MDLGVERQVVETAQAVGNGDAGWADLLTVWSKAAGADRATFQVWSKSSGHILHHVQIGMHRPDLQRAYVEHFQAFDPLLPVGLRCAAGDWVDSATDLPAQTWRGGGYYADLMRPLRIEQTVALCLSNDASLIASISLHADRETDASALKHRLGHLRPLMLRAFALRLQRAEADRQRLDSLLHAGDEGWLLLDARLRVHHADAMAQALLADCPALHLCDDLLQPQRSMLRQRLLQTVHAVQDGRPQQALHCAAGWGCVLRLQLQCAPSGLQAFGETLVLLRVHRRSLIQLPETDELRCVYGLTAAEARLVRELAAGHTLDDCEHLLDVSRNTLRNQLAAVFRKMGCNRQADVVRLAMLLC